ncbi:uncharacterized protein LOC115420813 isoform X2 [Sphaeramia orbicularis]|uniref:uncharacterized protein LOC115420813 isoform X2 n=1 Tax=Sphaeramia orbicularis TaxID=375764 RepID=UPI00117D8295|nr:uncharacterized protein LOC115420813 isoform X2 [Sphaeramia orbicularis]
MDQCEDRENGAPPPKTTDRTPSGPGPGPDRPPKAQRRGPGPGPAPGQGPSCVSMKSTDSKDWFFNFKQDRPSEIHQRPQSSGPDPGSSCVSFRSDRSMDFPLEFSAETVEQQSSEVPTGLQDQTQLDSIFKLLEENICTFVKNELKKFRQALSPDYPQCLESLSDDDEEQRREAFLKITLNFLRRLKQEELASVCTAEVSLEFSSGN